MALIDVVERQWPASLVSGTDFVEFWRFGIPGRALGHQKIAGKAPNEVEIVSQF